jgi:hypothetical protein
MRSNSKDRQMRERIAQEAARLMVEGGISDYYAAKRKAAARLGAPDTRNMPRNIEIEAALQSYQKLFYGSEQTARVNDLRASALEAMRFFSQFEPRLVGSVLSGTAGAFSDINLHLFADTPEDVNLFLMENQVPFEAHMRRLRMSRDRSIDYPVLRFVAGNATIDAVIFPRDGLRQSPCSPLDGKPMRRASIDSLVRLLEEESTEQPGYSG